MDSFSRFTLPQHPELLEAFDEIYDSFVYKALKSSEDGRYFINKIVEKRSALEKCILIDDSINNCKIFKKIGGQSYNTKNETQALKVLDKILFEVRG
ncbi:MAG: hypothetical protein UT05_C0016G0003 [Parcubacteria group bacterium GW2011_GWF2_38_76]|nr:MAG: hypothetical protein UT05_C0016G0003 [Parcubacteria group bacterium GW2011_GWF2_38_76]